MAYATSNPPKLVASGLAGQNIWLYSSADAAATVRVSGYFSNGYDLGMRTGDTVILTSTTGTGHFFVVNAATASAVDVTDGTAITATDTD